MCREESEKKVRVEGVERKMKRREGSDGRRKCKGGGKDKTGLTEIKD